MFLAYIDDSGTGDKSKQFQVMTAVIVPDTAFRGTEIFSLSALTSYIPSDISQLFWEKFEEFKGWELFSGCGPFDGIDQSIRFSIIDFLLDLVNHYQIPIVYGAVNKARLRNAIFGSANPVDICFRICMRGVEEYANGYFADKQVALLIADESNKDRKTIRDSFYDYRKRLTPVSGKLSSLHDDMYFGVSKYSIGIQMADLCGYFIAKNLEQHPSTAAQAFYDKVKSRIIYSKIEPE